VPIFIEALTGRPRVIRVVAAIVEGNGAFLVTRRLPGTHLAGLWEFPGGKVDEGETDAQALVREIREELDVDTVVGPLELETTHTYPDRAVTLLFYRCSLRGTPRPLQGQEMRWVARRELATLAFPPADEVLIRRLTSPAGR
jgi:8-oxo-dGTP diphosphatase